MSEDATGSGSEQLGGASSAPATGGASGAPVAGGVGTATRSPNGGASRLGRLVSGLPLPVHDHETPATGGELDYLRTAWGDDHLDPAGAPHAQYVTDAGLATALEPYATEADLGGYLTPAAADDLFLTPADGADAFAALGHQHPSQQSAPWRFQNVATVADPGAGNFRSNTGVLATATRIVLSRMTQDGYDTPATGYGVVGGDTIYIQDRDDNTKWVRFLVLEPLSRFTTYVTSLVAVIGSAGTITDSQICQLTFTLAGGGGGSGAGSALGTDALWDAKGDLVAASGNDAAARLPVGTTGHVLTADSAQALGVKWAAPAAGGGLATDPLANAKGDVFAASGNDAVGRLPVGANGTVLTADSAQSLGVAWGAAPTSDHGHGGGAGSGGALAAGASALTLIQEQVLGAPAGTITFSGIAQTYRTLVLEFVGRHDGAGAAGTGVSVRLRFNADTAANYDWVRTVGFGTAVTAATTLGETSLFIGVVPQTTDVAGLSGSVRLEVPHYTGTTFHKCCSGVGGYKLGATVASQPAAVQAAGYWRSAAAVTRLDVVVTAGNFVAGTYAALYGQT